MALRNTKVAQVPFISLGSGLTYEQEEKRRADLIAEFCTLCPQSKDLKGSVLDTRIEPRDTGVILEFFLNETPQSYLKLVNGTNIEPIGVGNDIFANDVTLVTENLHRCRELIRTAVNPAISLDMLREKSPIGDQIRFIRRRLRKREPFYLPSPADQSFAVPRFAQRFVGPAVVAIVAGSVTALFKRSVELTDAKLIGDVPASLMGISLPTRILMSRSSTAKDLDSLITFSKHLDSSQVLRATVGVNLDSVNGRAVSLKFRNFLAA